MKAKYLVVALLVVVLALAGTACNKVTGGGLFHDEWTGNKVTFGFNAQPISGDGLYATAKGHFNLIDHDAKMHINGSFEFTYDVPSEDTSGFTGTCSIDGAGAYPFTVTATDLGEPGVSAGDFIFIEILSDPAYYYQGFLEAGNIQVHKASKK